ncbi:piggyBac transposable element-derived protein 4-like [Physella acuta]|uniref:piggyBac transposable element-derived protein 4-like n=1 Tax=Physella acuta TaxID=109671 RepID=UPI0027DAF43B|nr:piggyBac transposable element-derived protein 4-like [Physella acuta]
MAFNFLTSLINDGAGPSHLDEDIDQFDNDEESDVDYELINDEESGNVHFSDDDASSSSDGEGTRPRRNEQFNEDGDRDWSTILTEVQLHDFVEHVGPCTTINADDSFTAFDYFSVFIPEEFYGHCVTETNRYALERALIKPDTTWKPVDIADIKLFMYINFMFGIHQLPHYKLYWSTNDLLNVPAVSKVMSRNRYVAIAKYFHLNNNAVFIPRGTVGHDPIFKVRPLFDTVLNNSLKSLKPEKDISIDEAMVAYTGRLVFKQYIKNKPSPWGIKLWCAADPHSGYLYNFDVYMGKSNVKMPNGLSYHVVFKMGEPFLDKYHHFYYDNYFTSVKLAEDLLQRDTYSCATIRPSRKGWPKEFKNLKLKKSATETGVRFRQIGNLVACFFHDKRPVQVLSTNAQPTMSTTQRTTAGGRVDVQIPTPVFTYNKGMGGVDLHDQLRSYYPIGRRSRKWWRSLVWFLLQVATINSYIIYKKQFMQRHPGQKPKTHLEFRLDLCHQLMAGSSVRQRAATDIPAATGTTTLDNTKHQPNRMFGRKKTCYECSRSKRKTPTNRPIETSNGCLLCKVHLCKGHCFAIFHNNL